MNGSYPEMRKALELANQAGNLGEVPIGAVVVRGGQIIGEGFNQVESLYDPTAHAEILAIRQACSSIENWRLEGCTLFVTLEPCPLCLSAIRLSRIDRVVYGAGDSRYSALTRFKSLLEDRTFGNVPEIVSGINSEESRELLVRFFERVRSKRGSS